MEKREERQIEKDLWDEERLEGVTVRVWWEERKRKEKREKVREFIVRERVGAKNYLFPVTTEVMEKDNIYRRCVAWERDYFPFFWGGGGEPIENKPYFY